MFSEGQSVKVKDPDGPGWIQAEYCEVSPEDPKHIDHPEINEGAGYDTDQAWVIYREGEREGTTGLHPFSEIRTEDVQQDR